MYFIGGDHYNNRIPHKDLQIFCHRLYPKIEWGLPESDLRHHIYNDVFTNNFYTRNDTSLKNFLSDCKANNIIPVVNTNYTYLDIDIPIDEFAIRVGIVDDIIFENGFELAYHSIMNEPGKRHTTGDYCNFVSASKEAVTHYKVIAGNDEYNMLDWNYLLDNADFDILGVHPLSSLGYPPNWQILIDWATMATARSKPYMVTEGGSWFKSCFTADGYVIIRDLILKAKNLGYLGTLIVLLDLNDKNYPKLAFNRYDNKYNTLKKTSDFWDDLINLVNTEGNKYNEQPEGVKDGMIIKTIGWKTNDVKSGYGVELLHELLLWKNYIEDVENMFVYDTATRTAVESFQTDLGIAVDGRVGRQTWRKFINSIDDSMVKNDFRFDFEVVMSPYNLEGDT